MHRSFRFPHSLPICLSALMVRASLAATGTTQVFFSPEGGCTDAIVREVRQASRSVHVQAFSFTSQPIARALSEASKRGVEVAVIFDQGIVQEPHAAMDLLVAAGVPWFLDREHSIAHNKVMVIDDSVVVTGSFNFTTAAEHHNAENVLVIHDVDLAARYQANWKLHRAHSQPGTFPGSVAAPTRSNRRSRRPGP
jgi:phosphatidylserine/phosphatidylglycerophosphate/cardiolipin synthase-like enzyme